MRRILLILALLLLAPLAVGARDFDYQDCTVGDGSCQPGDPYTSADANRVRDALNTNAIFYSEDYASGSSTFGIQEAHAACIATGTGGLVMVPREQVTINCAGVTGACLDLAAIDRAGVQYGSCELAGYGASQQDQLASDIKAASGIRFSNMNEMVADGNGDRAAIRVRGQGQVIRDMNLAIMTNTGAANQPFYGILASSADPNVVGGSLSDLRFERVVLTGNAAAEDAGGAGFGIGLRFIMKSTFADVSLKSFEENVRYEWTGANDLANNGNVWVGLNTRQAAVTNFRIGQGRACRSVSFAGGVNEDAPYGLIINGGSRCNVADLGVHWENTLVDVEIRSAEATYRGWAPTFSDSGTKTYNIVRTDAQAAGTGPDMVYGGRFDNGVDYSVPGTMIRIIDAADFAAGANVSGSVGAAYHADTDCQAEAPTTGVAGDLCIQDSDSALFRCDPGADGICNTGTEWVQLPSGGGGPGSDTDAWHLSVANELAPIQQGVPVAGDVLLYEDADEGYAKRKADLFSFLTDIDSVRLSEVNQFIGLDAATPQSSDLMIFEWFDAANYVKRKLEFGNFPAAGTNQQVQFNNNGIRGGDDGFLYDPLTDTLTIGELLVPAGPDGSNGLELSANPTVAPGSPATTGNVALFSYSNDGELYKRDNADAAPVLILTSENSPGGGDVVGIGSGTQAVNPVSLASGACDASITTAAAGVATTDVVKFSPAQQLSGSVGWGATDAIRMDVYVSAAGTITWEVCNPTSNTVDAVSRNFNWRVDR